MICSTVPSRTDRRLNLTKTKTRKEFQKNKKRIETKERSVKLTDRASDSLIREAEEGGSKC